jgi:hypothetical protein
MARLRTPARPPVFCCDGRGRCTGTWSWADGDNLFDKPAAHQMVRAIYAVINTLVRLLADRLKAVDYVMSPSPPRAERMRLRRHAHANVRRDGVHHRHHFRRWARARTLSTHARSWTPARHGAGATIICASVGQLVTLMRGLDTSAARHQRRIDRLQAWMNYRGLPPAMQERILGCFSVCSAPLRCAALRCAHALGAFKQRRWRACRR